MSLKTPPLADTLAAAATVVAAVLGGRTPEAQIARVDVPLRPAVQDLAFTALRDYGRGDFLLARLLEKPLKEKAIHALLLVVLARLERRPEDAYKLVDQAVRTAGGMAGGRFKGLVNGVLRNFLRRRDEMLTMAGADEVAHLRHPAWWLDSLRAAWPQEWENVVAAGNSHPPMCLRLNRQRTVGVDNAPASAGNVDLRSETGWTPAGRHFSGLLKEAGIAAMPLDDWAFLLETPVPVTRIPGFADGLCSVQDWGAQQTARHLDVRDGLRVLDACAAPGGKTAHLLEMADLDLTALELDPLRAQRIEENLQRLGLTAKVRTGDASQPAGWWDGRPFDRILADVPCSASGVVRRHPDIKWLRRAADVAGFARTQAAIVDALWPLLAAGGKMLYCTCSVFPEENRGQVDAFLTRHADARRLPLTTGEGSQPDLQLLPDATHDGFYYCLLEKI